MPELKPCPFCGNAGMAIEPSGRYLAFATCENDECAVVTKGYSTIEEAITAWNKRATEGNCGSCRCAKRAAKTDEEIIEAVSKDMENILINEMEVSK